MHTSSYWLTIPSAVMDALPYRRRRPARRRRRPGVRDAERGAAAADVRRPRHRRVDRRRRARAEDAAPAAAGGVPEALAAEPIVFIYDNYPGGIGFSRPLFEMHEPLLERTRELIAGCPCESGCPSCVGPEGNTGPHAKTVALRHPQRCLTGAEAAVTDGPLAPASGPIVRSGPAEAGAARADLRAGHRPYEATIDDRSRRRRARRHGRAATRSAVPRRRSALRVGPLARRASGSATAISRAGDGAAAARSGAARCAAARSRGASAALSRTRVHRPRDDRAERRRRHAGVSGRLRLVRSRRVPGPPVPAHEPRRRARAARAPSRECFDATPT